MSQLYFFSMIAMLLATFVMIRKLYDHLELRVNRELMLLVVGLTIDISGCIAMAMAVTVPEIMVDYRLVIIGRGLFGLGFILYYARSFEAKFSKIMLSVWVTDRLLCLLGSFVYRRDNLYLTNIEIEKYHSISMLNADKQLIYYAHIAVVFCIGAWALSLVLKGFIKIRKQNDKVQKYILVYYILGVALQGISVGIFEIYDFNHPDFSSALRGFMAVIYSVMAARYHFVNYESLARDTLLNDIGAGFIVLSTKYRILYHNEVAKEAFPELNTLEGISPFSESIKNAIDIKESEIQRMGVTYRVTADRIYDRKKLAGYSLLIINVTDFLVLEKQANVSRDAKEKLLTNMAHELRTPINAIAGEAEMMIRSGNSLMYPEYARNIQTSVDRLNDAFNYLLEAFNEETQVISPTDNPYNMCVLLDTVISNCEKRAEKKNIEFNAAVTPGLLFDTVGDDASLNKLLMSVISHGIRYTESGKVNFYVYCQTVDKGNCEYEFYLTSSDYYSKEELFPISQAKSVFEIADESQGLSYALSRRLLPALNGEMRIYKEKNRKNAIYIKITQKISSANTITGLGMADKLKVYLVGNTKEYWTPLIEAMKCLDVSNEYYPYSAHPEIKEDNKASVVITEYPTSGGKTKLNREYYQNCFFAYTNDSLSTVEDEGALVVNKPFSVLTIRKVFSSMDMIQGLISEDYSSDFIAPSIRALVVDDEYLNRKVAGQILEGFKIKVKTVASGYECLELLEKDKDFDIIFMDYMMEGLSGIDTTIQIRELDDINEVPIIAFTANDAPGAKEKYQSAGMNGVLFKPAGKEDFAKILRRYLPEAAILEKMPAESDKDSEASFDIEGLDAEVGLKYVSENVETYKSILIEYAKEIYDKAAKISEFYSMGDWYDFTVYVHGVKSASRMIGLEELGELMAGLEQAGKNEDRDYVDQNLTSTLDFYESYVPLLLALDDTKKDERSHSSLHKLVSEIKAAAEDFEMEDVETLVKELETGDYGAVDKEDLGVINESIRRADYYELVDCIEKLLDKIEAMEK